MKSLRVFAALLLFAISAQNLFAQNFQKAQLDESNFYEIRQQMNDYWNTHTPEKGVGHSVYRRWEWFREARVLPDGTFPPNNINAVEWTKYRSQHPQKDDLSAANWTSLGPNSSFSGYNGIGRINCIAVDPLNPNTLWVGTPAGGLWKSTNGGVSWSTNTDNFAVLGVTAIVIDPINPNTMYMGTGDGFSSDTRAIGVLKSTDGGITWNTTGLSWTVTNAIYIRYMAIHPTSPNVILVAASNGLYQTADGGDNWTKIATDDFYDVKFKPGDPSIVYAASDNRVYKSTNAGTTFAPAFTLTTSDRLAIAVTPANPELLAVVSSSSSSTDFGALRWFYVSTNSGTTFNLKSNSPNILGSAPDGSSVKGQGWYDLCIAVSPTNPNLMFVGGVNMWKSEDGGITWILLTHWRGSDAPPGTPVVHADKHCLLWNGNTLFQGCDGGIYKTSNDGASWTDISGNLAISQMYRLGVSQSDSKVICGLQDNGTKLRSNTGAWTDNIGGDGMECFIHPANSNIMYGEFQYGEIRRSINGGASWSNIHNNLPDDLEGSWITPFLMDPNTPSTIYAGYNDVYISTNQGNTWTAISSGLSPTNKLRFIVVAPTNSQVIYASDGYAVWKTTDGGAGWNAVNGNLPNSLITYLTVHPENADYVYVTFGGYTSGRKVYRTTSGGTTWTNISGTLPNLPANCVLVQPNSNGVLYAGMDVGVYRLEPGAPDWVLFNTGIPNVPVTELEIRRNTGKILASTYGRGLWESDLQPLTNPCDAPANLASGGIGPRLATLQWDAVNTATNYTLELRESGAIAWTAFTDIQDVSRQFFHFKPCTNYEFRVQSFCPGIKGPASAAQAFSTTGCSDYCHSFGQGANPTPVPQSGEWIEKVSIGMFENKSGNDWGYADYTGLGTDLTRGNAYDITLEPGFPDSGRLETWAVWIDFNRNNDFSDTGEQVFVHPGSTGAVSGSVAIPPAAAAGPARVRVIMKFSDPAQPCETDFYAGETEDYTINILTAPPALVIDPLSLGFPVSGESKTIALNTNCDWNVVDVPAWITVDPASGSAGVTMLTITASANASADTLLGTLTFSGCDGQIVQHLLVKQDAAPPALALEPANLEFIAPGETKTITVNTNCDWSVLSVPAWLTIDPASGNAGATMVAITAAVNGSLSPQSQMLVFSGCAGQIFQTLGVLQSGAAPTLSISPADLVFPASGETQILLLNTNCDWSIGGTPSWLTVEPDSGTAGIVQITVTAAANGSLDPQSANLLFSGCDGLVEQNFSISQFGTAPVLSLDPSSLDFPADGESKTILINANCDWSVGNVPAWLTVEPDSAGAGVTSVTITAISNAGIDVLTASLPFSGCDGQIVQNLAVTQGAAAPLLALDPGSLDFSAVGEVKTVTLQTNCDWSVSNIPAWLLVEPASGAAGTVTVNITASANVSIGQLSALLLFSGCNGQVSQALGVTQAAAPVVFQVNPAEFVVEYMANCISLILHTNTSWTAFASSPWILSITPESGAGSDTLEICFTENTDTISRSAVILLKPGGADSVSLLIVQKPKTVGLNNGGKAGNNVRCMPNPARYSALFYVEADKMQTIQLDILTPNGQLVYSTGKKTVQHGQNVIPWQTDDLPAGHYHFRCLFEKETVTGNIVLIR